MTSIISLDFLAGAAERAVKTFAQALASTLVISTGGHALGIADQNLPVDLGVAVLAALLSVLTSIGASDFTAGVPTSVPVETSEDPQPDDALPKA